MHTRNVLAVLVLTLAPGLLAGQEPRAILERAVEAHGGMERLSRARADWIKIKGTLYVADKEVPFVGETTVQLPDRFKNVMQLTPPGGSYQLVQILNGDRAHVAVGGQPQKVSPTAAAEMRETLHLDRAIRLVPLLRDPTFELAGTGESEVNGRKAVGLRVRARGKKELRLYFDRETSLLVKTEHTLEDGNGKEVRQEGYYSDFREVGGYKRPLKMSAFRNGKKVMDAELLDVKYFERIDDSEFAIP